MKHFILSFILLACSAVCMAQINLREGIVITLAGDTLHGSIDYRTDPMNSEQCLFIPDGKNEPTIYRPGEIAGYRFLDNGRFYVTKKIIDENSKHRTLFLEYVVRGNLSLYRLSSSINNNLFLIEDENGKMAQFSEEGEQLTNNEKQLHKNNLKPVLSMLSKSQSTQKMLWENAVNNKSAIKAVVNYNNEVCPEGVCEILEYKNKKTPNSERLFHPTIMAGITNYKAVVKDDKDKFSVSFESAWNVSCGVDYYAQRLNRGLFGEIYVTYYQVKETEQYLKGETWVKETTTMGDLTMKFGAGYQLKDYRIQPRIHGGYSVSNYWIGDDYNGIYHGFYVAAGLAYPIKKGAFILNCEFNQTRIADPILWDRDEEDPTVRFRRLSLSIGYQFGY